MKGRSSKWLYSVVLGTSPLLVSVVLRFHAVPAHRHLTQRPLELHLEKVAVLVSVEPGLRGVQEHTSQHHQGLHGHDHLLYFLEVSPLLQVCRHLELLQASRRARLLGT